MGTMMGGNLGGKAREKSKRINKKSQTALRSNYN